MNELFLKIINMSISASWLVLAVLILRSVLKKAPKWVNVLLWGIVAIRLICPFSFESAFSLIPSAETFPKQVISGPSFDIQTGIAPVDSRINDYLGDRYFEGVTVPVNNGNNVMSILAIAWIIGILLLVAYTIISYWHLHREIDTAVRYDDNIFQSENVSSPFVLGIIKPRIYLPFNMTEQNLRQVVAHEQAHIRRKDHWWKLLGFLLLTIHWFNTLMWLAYVLLCRDIELACDEKVIKELDNEQRADYTKALVECSVNRRMIAACPIAFGEVGAKERVKSVMNYKKPTFWVIILAVITCAIVAVCFLTNPKQDRYALRIVVPAGSQEKFVYTDEINSVIEWFDYTENPSAMDDESTINLPIYPDVTFSYNQTQIIASKSFDTSELTGHTILITGMPIWNAYFTDLTGDGYPEICATYTFGSGIIDSRIIIYDYANGASYELSDRGNFDFVLRFDEADEYLYVDKTKYNTDELVESGRLVFEDDCLQVEGFSSNTDKPTETRGLIPMVMVNGTLYLDTGHESKADARCGVKSIELSMPNSSGGFTNADSSLLKKGELDQSSVVRKFRTTGADVKM